MSYFYDCSYFCIVTCQAIDHTSNASVNIAWHLSGKTARGSHNMISFNPVNKLSIKLHSFNILYLCNFHRILAKYINCYIFTFSHRCFSAFWDCWFLHFRLFIWWLTLIHFARCVVDSHNTTYIVIAFSSCR
jgi:hypothetical protein